MKKLLATLFATALAIGIPVTAASAEETASTCSYECVWTGETAWASGDDFAGANWAMFYKLQGTPAGVPYESTPIYAGQHFLVGHAYFTPGPNASTVTIWIIFDGPNGDGAYLTGGNSVKVGYWTSDPSAISNPAPGKFAFKAPAYDPRYTSITVPFDASKSNYYAIHLDMMVLS